MRALSKDPDDRFQRVEDLQRLLVEAMRAAGSSSVEGLLDSARLRRLSLPAVPAATSDEVDAYERKLRRKRHGAVGLAALLVGAAAAAAFLVPHDGKLRGVESKLNDTAAEATALPLGQKMTGQLGKRVDASHGDRDFYALDLPARRAGRQGFLGLRVSALPTMALCAILYKPGFADAVRPVLRPEPRPRSLRAEHRARAGALPARHPPGSGLVWRASARDPGEHL